MTLDNKLLRAKQYYDDIQIDSVTFEQRVFSRIAKKQKVRSSLILSRIFVGAMTPLVAFALIVGFAPSVRANALLSIEQISSKVFSLNYTHPIDGFVVINGRKLTNEQYKMLFAKAVWTKNGYKVEMRKHVRLEVQSGQSVEYPSLQKAMKAANLRIEAPTFTPKNIKQVQYYANDSSMSIWYHYSGDRQVYLTVFQSSAGAEGLDNIHKVKIGNRWATVGETPQLYEARDGTIKAKANYVVDCTNSHGLQYRIAGQGFSEADLIQMMKSVPTL